MKSQTGFALIAGLKPLMAWHTINVRIRPRPAKLVVARLATNRAELNRPQGPEGDE